MFPSFYTHAQFQYDAASISFLNLFGICMAFAANESDSIEIPD